MATWGARNGYVRLGYEYSVSGTSSSKTVTLKFYLQAVGGWVRDDYNTFRVWGDWSYTRSNIPISLSDGQTAHLATLTKTVTPSFSNETRHVFGASIGLEGGSPSVSGYTAVPARAVTVPRNPNPFTATRRSDKEIRLSWGNTATSDRPVDRYTLNRWDNVDGKYRKIADLSKSATSYVDKGTRSNRRYRYIIYAHNAAGHATGVYSAYIATTPAAPSSVAAWFDPEGLAVGWKNNATYQTGLQIYDNGKLIGSAEKPWDTKWTHASPDTSTPHQYTVRAVADGLLSPHSSPSNTVRLAAPPFPPSYLIPNGAWSEIGEPVRLSWDHVPADASSQTKYQIRFRGNYVEEWTTLPVVDSLVSEHSQVFLAETVEWQVRTWGRDADKPGAWSDSARFFQETAPILTITGPPAGTVNADSTTVTFEVSNKTDWSWEAEVVDLATGRVHQSASGQHTHPRMDVSQLENGQTYTIRVTPYSFVAGERQTRNIMVTYPAPPRPNVEAVWDRDLGTVTITVENVPGDPPAVGNRLERLVADGPNVVLYEDMPLNSSYIDWVAVSGAPNQYQVVTRSALGIETYVYVTVTDSETYPIRHVIVSSEDGGIFQQLVWDPETSRSPVLQDATLHHFIGRDKPVMFAGTQTSRVASFGGVVLRDEAKAALPEWDAIAVYTRPLLVRDPIGLYQWSHVSGVSMDRESGTRAWHVSFTAEEVHYVA